MTKAVDAVEVMQLTKQSFIAGETLRNRVRFFRKTELLSTLLRGNST